MPEIDAPILGMLMLRGVVVLLELEPTGSRLHDEYLGVSDDLSELHIVFEGEYEPEDYELLDVFDEEKGHSVAVYDANAHLVPYLHYVLAADYAGAGGWRVMERNQ